MNNVLNRKKVKFSQIFRKFLPSTEAPWSPGWYLKILFNNNINAKFRVISRNDQQTQKHILYFIATLHFQDSGRIQNGAQDWQTFLIITKHRGNEVWN